MNHMKNTGLQNQRIGPQLKRGRKMLDVDKSLLFDAFGLLEPNHSQFTKLRLFVDLDTNKLRVSDVGRYPYALGLQAKEVDIVHNDITKGDEQGNNSRDLFMEPLGNFNLEFT